MAEQPRRIQLPELKPCPFCGNGAYFYESHPAGQPWEWGISCDNNDCPMGMDGFPRGYSADGVARAWNARPPAVPVEALRELLSDSFSGEDELRGRISELIDYAREDT